jgi:uncharacterized protein YqjF (DUF2071 family)
MSTGVFLRADWRWLAMLNYEADPSVLDGLVPAGTEIDLYEGACFLSVVGFRFLRTRVWGVPVPFHRDFDEVNLRFYVRRRAADGWRRGVVFVKELVPRRAVAWVARTLYGENYHAVPMRHEVVPPTDAAPGSVAYEWRAGKTWHGLRIDIAGKPAAAAEDSQARFITEHYWGYAGGAGRRTNEYEVQHPSWWIWNGENPTLRLDAAAVYGDRFADVLAGPPASAFVADGSAVTVHQGTRL